MVADASGAEIDHSALERLEALDDAIFAALEGDPLALDRLEDLWNAVHRDVERPFVRESQAVYSRHARQVLEDLLSYPEVSLSRQFAALEVLDLVDQA